MRYLLLPIFIIILSFSSLSYSQNNTEQDFTSFRKSLSLGTVNMQVTTANTLAKEHFLLGLTFLHSFMYDLAIDQFQQAQNLDPGFAMSYWGEALANKHPIWSYEDLARAQAILKAYEKNKDQRQLSEMEKDYLKSVEILFSPKSLSARDNEYAQWMAQSYQRHPNDTDLGAFYALSLLGIASDFPNDKNSQQKVEEGRTLISKLFKQFPDHPGVVHYYIHYYDVNDIALARQAMPAAAIALKVMSSSSHVTHMSAHIYRRLGLWDEFNEANLISVNSADKLCKQLNSQPLYACNAENKYHSFEWLQYGYLKKKRFHDADKLVQEMAAVAKKDPALKYQQWYYTMWARQVLAGKNWKTKPIQVKPIAKPGDQLYWSAYAECGALLASGFLAAHQHQPTNSYLSRLDQIIGYTNTLADPYIRQSCEIAKLEVQAETALQAKKESLGLDYMKQALTLQRQQISTELTPSLPFLPVQRYYADYLSTHGDEEQARSLRNELLLQYPNDT